MNEPRAGVIADDLSGAAEVGSAFARRGLGVAITLGPSQGPALADVLVDVAGPRARPATGRRERVARAMARRRPELVVAKVDSCLRGDPAGLVATCRASWPARTVVVSPAFPRAGRTTVDGVVHARDGGGARMTELFGGAHVASARVARGPLAVRHAIRAARRAGETVVTVDASSDDDLDAIAAAADHEGTIFVGSLGLSAALTRRLGSGDGGASATFASPALIVAGSTHAVTRAQLAALAADRGDALGAVAVARDRPERAVGRAVAELARGRSVVLEPAAVHRDGPSLRALEALAVAAAGAIRRRRDTGSLLLLGGDLAELTCRALGVRRLRPAGTAGLAVTALAADDGARPGLELGIKGGAAGGPETLLECLGRAS